MTPRPALLIAAIALVALVGLHCSSSPEAADDPDPEPTPASQPETASQDEPSADYPEELQTPPPHDRDYDIAEVYDAMCASCHGEEGDGEGIAQTGFAFDTPADQWTNRPSVDGILLTLEDGIHDTAMQDFPQFSDVDRVDLAQHILDLRHALLED